MRLTGMPAEARPRAVAIRSAVITDGWPNVRAAARPASVSSRINDRSNSTNAPKMENIRPAGVVVSIPSVDDRNRTPRSARSVTMVSRWTGERPGRSSFHTTTVSPGVKARSSRSFAGGEVGTQLAQSISIRAQPVARRASCCVGSVSTLETRA